MKILYVGDLNSYARANQRANTLQEMGYEVKKISYVPIGGYDVKLFPKPWKKNNKSAVYLHDRIKIKLGYLPDLVDINSLLISACEEYRPDLIWIDKAATIKPHTYKKIRSTLPDTKLVYYSEDDIYVRRNRSKYLSDSLNIFDVVFTTKPRNLHELPLLGTRDVFVIYKAFDMSFHRPLKLSEEDRQKWGCDVSFVGSFEQDRAEKMLYLAQNGIRVRIWGWYWERFHKKHPNLILENKPVFNEEYIKVINATSINLSFLRKIHRDKHTARSVEIPACKAFMLTERTDEHLHLFEEGKEAEFFDSNEEMLQKVKYYLGHKEKRLKIATEGRKRCLRDKYSHHGRLELMLDYVVASNKV